MRGINSGAYYRGIVMGAYYWRYVLEGHITGKLFVGGGAYYRYIAGR